MRNASNASEVPEGIQPALPVTPAASFRGNDAVMPEVVSITRANRHEMRQRTM